MKTETGGIILIISLVTIMILGLVVIGFLDHIESKQEYEKLCRKFGGIAEVYFLLDAQCYIKENGHYTSYIMKEVNGKKILIKQEEK